MDTKDLKSRINKLENDIANLLEEYRKETKLHPDVKITTIRSGETGYGKFLSVYSVVNVTQEI